MITVAVVVAGSELQSKMNGPNPHTIHRKPGASFMDFGEPWKETNARRYQKMSWYHHGFFLTRHQHTEVERHPPDGSVVPETKMFGQWGIENAGLQWTRALISMFGNVDSRKVFIDIGSRNYGSSYATFMAMYPHADEFDKFAFDPNPTWAAEFPEHGVKFFNYAVSTENATIHMSDLSGGAHFSETGHEAKTIDFAEWLERNVKPSDFVVVKLDIEGHEFQLLPALMNRRVITLMDEIFIECHSDTHGPCLELFVHTQHAGVWTHDWPY